MNRSPRHGYFLGMLLVILCCGAMHPAQASQAFDDAYPKTQKAKSNRFRYLNQDVRHGSILHENLCQNHGQARCLDNHQENRFPSRYRNTMRQTKVHPYLRKLKRIETPYTQNF